VGKPATICRIDLFETVDLGQRQIKKFNCLIIIDIRYCRRCWSTLLCKPILQGWYNATGYKLLTYTGTVPALITNNGARNMKHYTLKQIKKAWLRAYGEDMKSQYKGFFKLLKEQGK